MALDLKLIQNDVEEIIKHSQNYDFDIDCSELIEKWYAAKKPFIDMFKGKTIIRTNEPYDFAFTPAMKEEKFLSFVRTLEDDREVSWDVLNYLIKNEEGFFSNKVINSLEYSKIVPGMKLSKSFKHLDLSKAKVRELQDRYSRIIQEEKITGYLYMSVDPRDYLTLSENNANWRSCHSLDGEYSTGNLNYMIDSSTVIFYLASDKLEQLSCAPEGLLWNSKKWRVLGYFSEDKDILYYGKQYPYSNPLLYSAVWETLIQPLFKNFSHPFKAGMRIINDEEYPDTYLSISNLIINTKDIIFNKRDTHQYNDVLLSSTYETYVSINRKTVPYHSNGLRRKYLSLFKTEIGEPVHCLCGCGRILEDPDIFICDECSLKHGYEDGFPRCCVCGCRVDPDDAYKLDDGSLCCVDCY